VKPDDDLLAIHSFHVSMILAQVTAGAVEGDDSPPRDASKANDAVWFLWPRRSLTLSHRVVLVSVDDAMKYEW